jgi:hypothetical protein
MIDLSEITGEIKPDQRQEFLTALTKVLLRMGDPFKMPELMSEWLKDQTQHGVDTYYVVPVGDGSLNLQLRFTFKREMIFMEFVDPFSTRLMEIRLHAL